VGLPLTIDVKIECGKFTVITVNRRIAFFNHCLSLIAYDLHKEQYCNSGNNSSGTVTSMFAFYRLYYCTIRDSEKSASQNKLNNLNKLSAKLRILFSYSSISFNLSVLACRLLTISNSN